MVFYRDGVGDGQIPYVVEHEVAAITNCFKEAVQYTRENGDRRRGEGLRPERYYKIRRI